MAHTKSIQLTIPSGQTESNTYNFGGRKWSTVMIYPPADLAGTLQIFISRIEEPDDEVQYDWRELNFPAGSGTLEIGDGYSALLLPYAGWKNMKFKWVAEDPPEDDVVVDVDLYRDN